MKKIAVVTGVTKDIAFAAANIYMSIVKYAPDLEFDFIVYHQGIAADDRKIFNSFKNFFLKLYSYPHVKSTIESSRGRYSDLAFSKFEIFSLLDNYEAVLWIDADISVQGDISPLFEYGPIGFATSSPNYFVRVVNNFTQPVEGYDMERQSINSGVIVVTQGLDSPHALKEWCYEQTAQLGGVLKYADQGIFALLLQAKNLGEDIFPTALYNANIAHQDSHGAILAHANGPEKFWANGMVCLAFPEWWRMHQKWLAMGGGDFSAARRKYWELVQAPQTSTLKLLESGIFKDQAKGLRGPGQWSNLGKRDERAKALRDNITVEKLLEVVFGNELYVRNGPFKGLRYSNKSCGGAILPKILGSYEDPLHPWIEEIAAKSYDTILNVGSAEGYFAVGFACMEIAKTVVAYDINPVALPYMQEIVALNKLHANLEFVSLCDREELSHHCKERSLIFCDIEGAELSLLDPSISPELLHTDMIVEIHDVFIPGITSILVDRFIASHKIDIVYDSKRTSANYIFPQKVPEKMKEIIMDENRPMGMSWMRLIANE